MKKLLIAILVLAAIPAFAQRKGFGALKSGVGLTVDNVLTGDNTFSGSTTFSGTTVFSGNVGIGRTPTVLLDVATSGATNAFFGVAATGTGAAQFAIDASNGDFSGADFFTFQQDNSLNATLYMGANGGSIAMGTLGADPVYIVANNLNAGIFATTGIPSFPYAYSHDMNGETIRALQINDSGELGYDSSTRRAKTNIQNIGDTSWIYLLSPVRYESKNTGKQRDGLIAEEVAEIDSDYVFYDKIDGKLVPGGVHYAQFVVPLIAEIQRLHVEVEKLKRLHGK